MSVRNGKPISVDQAAERLRLSTHAVLEAIASGDLPHQRVEQTIILDDGEVCEYDLKAQARRAGFTEVHLVLNHFGHPLRAYLSMEAAIEDIDGEHGPGAWMNMPMDGKPTLLSVDLEELKEDEKR